METLLDRQLRSKTSSTATVLRPVCVARRSELADDLHARMSRAGSRPRRGPGQHRKSRAVHAPAGEQSPAAKAVNMRRWQDCPLQPIRSSTWKVTIATAHLIWTGVTNEGVGKPFPACMSRVTKTPPSTPQHGQWQVADQQTLHQLRIAGCPIDFDATWKPQRALDERSEPPSELAIQPAGRC